MEEKRNYVIYLAKENLERVVLMTFSQAQTINWFIEKILECEDGSCIVRAEDYDGEEI
jgi:hypothetical protein